MSALTLDGMSLGGRGEAAAGFRITPAAPAAASYERDDGWSASIAAGSDKIAARGPAVDSYLQAALLGLEVAEEALDYFALRGATVLATAGTENEHVAVWEEGGTRVLRIVRTEPLGVNAGGGMGGLAETGRFWDQSMRFYRRSQLSDDLYDSLRNIWLAVESLLDSIEPQQPEEREGVWVERALRAVAGKVSFDGYLPPGASGDLAGQAYAHFYADLRHSVFHSKGGHAKLVRLPNHPAWLRDVAERHERLTRFYIDLLNQTHGIIRPGGVMTNAGFEAFTPGFEVDPKVHVSDDESPCRADDETVNPAGGQVIEVVAARDQARERPGLKILAAEIGGADAEALGVVRRVSLTLADRLVICTDIAHELVAADLDRLDVQFGVRLDNKGTALTFATL